MTSSPRRTVDEATKALLTAHQRFDIGSCLCGWAELGKSHPGHQVAMLRQASLLNDAPVQDASPG